MRSDLRYGIIRYKCKIEKNFNIYKQIHIKTRYNKYLLIKKKLNIYILCCVYSRFCCCCKYLYVTRSNKTTTQKFETPRKYKIEHVHTHKITF